MNTANKTTLDTLNAKWETALMKADRCAARGDSDGFLAWTAKAKTLASQMDALGVVA